MNAVHKMDAGQAAAMMAALSENGSRTDGRDVVALKYKRINNEAYAPRYATDGSGCFDLMADCEGSIDCGGAMDVSTGLAFEIPATHVMLIFSRSGHGFKNGVRLANCVGVIDSDYRGEVRVKLHNDGNHPFHILPGVRIAQAMLVPIPTVMLLEVDELSETARGAGGFGSTGN
jgi:dUTP pyrophosphatase